MSPLPEQVPRRAIGGASAQLAVLAGAAVVAAARALFAVVLLLAGDAQAHAPRNSRKSIGVSVTVPRIPHVPGVRGSVDHGQVCGHADRKSAGAVGTGSPETGGVERAAGPTNPPQRARGRCASVVLGRPGPPRGDTEETNPQQRQRSRRGHADRPVEDLDVAGSHFTVVADLADVQVESACGDG